MDTDGRTQIGAYLYSRHSLIVALVCVSLVAGCLALGNLYLIWRSGEIYYTWLGAGVQVARPGEVPRQAIAELSLSMVRTLGNVNAEGMPGALEAAKSVMTARFRLAFESVMQAHLQDMRDADITMLMQSPVVQRINKVKKGSTSVYQTYITAERSLFVGDIPLEPHSVTIMVESYPVIVESSNIYGLWVNNMEWPRLNTVEGEIAQVKATQSNGHRSRKQRRGNSILNQ